MTYIKFFLGKISVILLVMVTPIVTNAQTTETFNSGTSWTVPCGVTSVTITVWGGGGGGGGSSTNNLGGNGGGGGASVTNTFTVSPGNVINYTIGAAGAAGGAAAGTGGNGGQTSVTAVVPVISMSAAGGTGGLGNGVIIVPPVSSTAGANGISAGGTITNGTNGTRGGVSGGTGGGAGNGGGNVAGSTSAAGLPGSAPGGGGSGGEDAGGGSGDRAGGAGGVGQIRFTYTSTITAPNAGPNQTACGTLTMAGNTPDVGWTGTWSVVAGTATITSINSPTSTVTGIPAGTCATLRWTFSQVGCVSLTDDVILCAPNVCNDEPCIPTPLTVVSGLSCTPTVSMTSVGATASTGMPEPPCGSFTPQDVWYSVVVPANGTVSISGIAGTMSPVVSIYDGSCSALASNGCVNLTHASQAFPLTYTGTPGSTILIRVNGNSLTGGATGTFGICAFSNTNTASQVLPGVTTTVTCGSSLNFYDPGGPGGTAVTATMPAPAGNYTNNTSTIYTICPSDPLQYVSVNFSSFLLETGFDKLFVLSGNTVIAQWTGTEGLGDIVTSQNPGECLTFSFQADYIVTASGWEALVTCTTTPVAPQITNASSVSNCNGNGGVWVCADGIYNTAAGSGAGVQDVNEASGGCWGAAGEVATSWFYFTIATSGVFAFEFVPSNNGHNINFALYGPSLDTIPPCPLSSGDAPIRCSFAGAGGINTGLASGQTDLYDEGNGNGMAAPVNVIAGQTYALVVDVYQNGQPPTETQIDFTGAASLDCSVTLPITLGDFSGINQDRTNLLNWIVYSQINNDYFTIYRSYDAKKWDKVGEADGAGTVQEAMYYSLVDENPFFPISYYRLKQTDFDGNFSYSDVISVTNFKPCEGDIVGNFVPNPTNDFTNAVYQGHKDTPLNVSVIDNTGKVIGTKKYAKPFKGMSIAISTAVLANGIYQVVFTQDDKIQTQKLSVLH